MCPASLRESLKSSERRPKYLYINPTGANPTGTILSESRRSGIYRIVCENDLILLEDDPYYYVQVRHWESFIDIYINRLLVDPASLPFGPF